MKMDDWKLTIDISSDVYLPLNLHNNTTRARTLSIHFREVMGDRHTHGVAEVEADPT